MKKISAIIIFLLLLIDCFGQEWPSIIPPSPNASSLHVYGNTQVNYYTGSPNIIIPIWEVKEGNLTLPIYLKYTAGNGVKVEEIGSWVGLGWTLNTGGAISRTIRGIADEDQTKRGLFKMTELPLPNKYNMTFFDQIKYGKADGESDIFMYNYPGGSGTFFYDYDKSIYLKPKKDILVTHNIGVESESIALNHCLSYDEVITDFTIKDEQGSTYLFKDKERSNTVTLGHSYYDNRGFPSTWYLSKMENSSKTHAINFEYDTYPYSLLRTKSISIDNIEEDVYTETSYIGKRLKKIMFSQGSVEFISSIDYRKDFSNNKYLDKIIIKNINGKVIKTIVFRYKYMTSSSLVDPSTNIGISDENRLILYSVKECSGNNKCKDPYLFTYNTDNYLPSRFSKAQDHWGYYNGKILNTKKEPKHFITWYNPTLSEGVWITELVGYADRSPDVIYSKSGILTGIQYPTKGKTIFNYESHTAVHNQISGEITSKKVVLAWQNRTTDFSIDLHSIPLSQLKLTGHVAPGAQCDPIIYIKNLKTKDIYTLSLQLGQGKFPSDVLLKRGNYQVWFVLNDENGNLCSQTDPVPMQIRWDNESNIKKIGGVRIKNIIDYSSNNILSSNKSFEYDEDNIYSGRIVNVPKYYGLTYLYDTSSVKWFLAGYKRYVNSTTPLATTHGSHVGYGKVTVSNEQYINGYTEYYYTTADDYPDTYNSINPSGDIPHLQIFQGVKIYPYPTPMPDSKDFLRGLLKKQVIYKKKNNTFSKVYEKLYSYDILKYSYGDFPSLDNYIKNAAKAVRNLKIGENGDLTYYDIFTGYALPTKTIEREFSDTETLEKILTLSYERNSENHNNDLIKKYKSISQEVNTSDGRRLKTVTTFIFNKANLTLAELRLKTKNALYIPVQVDTYIDTSKVVTKYREFKDWGYGRVLLDKEQYIKGDNVLEDIFLYHDYDDKGNPLEVSKKDGTRICYIWGYNKTQVIAKIENASYSQVSMEVKNLQTLSNADNDRTLGALGKEGTLRSALQDLRILLSDAQVTTYTYDPLIGVTSITNPRGETIYYHYDDFNRLKHVKDAQGNILSKNKYYYKNQ